MRQKSQKQPRKITPRYLENAALYYLQRYASSAENLARVLRRKVQRSCAFYQEPADPHYEAVEKIVDRFKASGLLNDKTFAESKTGSLRRLGLSQQAIGAKLAAKGLKRDDIEQALRVTDADSGHADPELEAALAFTRRKKLGRFRKGTADQKLLQKEMAALGRAGFSYEMARRALSFSEED